METNQTQSESMVPIKPQEEHRWLQKLVGEWTYETEVVMGPDQPAEKATGTESVRSLGEFWIMAEGQGEMPGCGFATTMITLGYDLQKQQYVGTWIASIMDYLWLYEGELDAAKQVLNLNSEGPDMIVEGKTAQYRDVIEFKSEDYRTMASYVLGNNGQWQQFMTTHYRRSNPT